MREANRVFRRSGALLRRIKDEHTPFNAQKAVEGKGPLTADLRSCSNSGRRWGPPFRDRWRRWDAGAPVRVIH